MLVIETALTALFYVPRIWADFGSSTFSYNVLKMFFVATFQGCYAKVRLLSYHVKFDHDTVLILILLLHELQRYGPIKSEITSIMDVLFI